MAEKTGRFAIIEQFLADGIRYMFGNPGTVEEGLLDALAEFPELTYIETLQETVAVAAADGYARATKRPAVVQLHSVVGLGNSIGMMYQAFRGHAPLVVVAGEAGMRYDAMDAQMAADLVSMAKPVTKWAARVVDPSSLLRVLRRAIKVAGTAPMGPVFVALPMDVLDAPVQEEVVPSSFPVTRTAPEAADVARATELLAVARKPIVVVGDGIAASGAQDELAHVAELVGAEVWGADSSETNLSARHPLFRGLLGHMFGEESQRVTSQADVVLICGTYVFPEVFPVLSGALAPGAKVVHIDLDPHEIAKNFPTDLAIVSDPKTTLGKLADALEAVLTSEQKAAASSRAEAVAAAEGAELQGQLAADREHWDAVPLHVSRFAEELAARLPEDAFVFDEALTNSPEVVRYLPPTKPGHYFQTRGGSLGVGIPGAIGVKLAHPDKTVVGFTGDGGSMYTPQALWTAAHHRIGAKSVVCNNRSYRILKLNIQRYWAERDMPEHDFPAPFDLTNPEIRFDELARSLGVAAVRVETPEQIGPAIERMLADDEPFLIDLVVTDEVPGGMRHVKCGQ
jgi:benzoylformate decarboxylase